MTAEDLFLVSGDDAHYELVAGSLVRMPPAGALHGKIAARVARVLDEFADAERLGVVCGAETGFVLRRDPDTVRAPDVSFVAKERLAAAGEPEKYWPFAPDLVVEIVSSSDRAEDLREKIAEYFAAGTRMAWIVHPRTREVVVHRGARDVRVLGEGDELVGEDVLPGFACPVRRLFE